MRYFRCLAGDETYEQVRLTLDAAWGHPNTETKTITCIEPAATAPRDTQGRILLATNDEFCKYQAAAEMLPDLLGNDVIEELDEATYRNAQPAPAL